jgi:hypothetical protein
MILKNSKFLSMLSNLSLLQTYVFKTIRSILFHIKCVKDRPGNWPGYGLQKARENLLVSNNVIPTACVALFVPQPLPPPPPTLNPQDGVAILLLDSREWVRWMWGVCGVWGNASYNSDSGWYLWIESALMEKLLIHRFCWQTDATD